ncbi:DR2241 family protein [Halobacterium zhouii]|uniref:DR2241 family protein n=1 Tax=Halobacterium zhouii TaxID=2902624 RepID=UPI001E6398A5|nr:DR2241 family protein [Halobacterium zhouii]
MSVADELVDAADAGIDFDGLTVEPYRDAYRWQTAEEDAVLTAAELRERTDDPYATNWHYWEREVEGRGTARRAFLRWVEGADVELTDGSTDERADDLPVPERYEGLRGGHTRTWGELAVTVVLSEDGTRRYDVRHEDDVGENVDAYTDPLEARHLVKHDDDGRYRPLSTAPTLPHGWAFVDLDAPDLVQTVEYVYPATVANWWREQNGDLDVTNWEETAERQSGIYQIVEQLDREALEWAVEACCVDSQCVKRREWDASEDDELEAPRGDGEFPCREPCSVFVSAARKFVTLEREESREYTLELTPAEKEQLEALVDAVADDSTGEIREADLNEPANRYRARYLRAKRMDEQGFTGTPTYPEDHE